MRLSGYKLVRADNLSNNKKSGVGIYYKETLAVWSIPVNQLEVFIEKKKYFYYHYVDQQVNQNTNFMISCFV